MLRHPGTIAGLVLTSPFWKLALPVPPVKVCAGRIASRLYPEAGAAERAQGRRRVARSGDRRVYDRDPLNNKNATARWFTEASTAQESLVARASALTLPVLLHRRRGGPDRRGVRRRASSSTASARTDKTLRMLAGQYHEVLNEPKPDREKTVAEIVEWLRAHAAAAQRQRRGKVARVRSVNYIVMDEDLLPLSPQRAESSRSLID